MIKLDIQLFGGRGASSSNIKASSKSDNSLEVKKVDWANYVDNIPSWWKDKELGQGERYAIENARSKYIDKETEKAVKVVWKTDYGNVSRWVPKKLMEKPFKGMGEKAPVKPKTEYEDGLAYNERIRNYAKEKGIKVRRGMKTETLREKIIKAGYEVPKRKGSWY